MGRDMVAQLTGPSAVMDRHFRLAFSCALALFVVWVGVNACLEAWSLHRHWRGSAPDFRLPGAMWVWLLPVVGVGAVWLVAAWRNGGRSALAARLSSMGHITDAPSRWLGWVTAVLVVVMVALVWGQVVARYGFSVGEIWVQESGVWLHAGVFMLGAAYALSAGAHVRIDVLSGRYSPRGRAVMEIVGVCALATPFIWFIWTRSTGFVSRSWRLAEKSAEVGGLPAVFLLKSVILVFCLAMALALAASVLRSLAVLVDPRVHDGLVDDAPVGGSVMEGEASHA